MTLLLVSLFKVLVNKDITASFTIPYFPYFLGFHVSLVAGIIFSPQKQFPLPSPLQGEGQRACHEPFRDSTTPYFPHL